MLADFAGSQEPWSLHKQRQREGELERERIYPVSDGSRTAAAAASLAHYAPNLWALVYRPDNTAVNRVIYTDCLLVHETS